MLDWRFTRADLADLMAGLSQRHQTLLQGNDHRHLLAIVGVLGAECLGTGPNPRESEGFVFQVRGTKTTEVVERHGIIGLACHTTEIRLSSPADVVDVGVAHFGEPPTVVAYAGGKEVAKITLDTRQRQIENARLVGAGIEQVTVASSDGETVLNYVRA